jgi:hypothetical protein
MEGAFRDQGSLSFEGFVLGFVLIPSMYGLSPGPPEATAGVADLAREISAHLMPCETRLSFKFRRYTILPQCRR